VEDGFTVSVLVCGERYGTVPYRTRTDRYYAISYRSPSYDYSMID